MARSSPGVKRVAAILDFMASHPDQSFVLTDLVRALKLSRATCHSILTGLVEVGYLYRTTDKTYVLGPALAAIGRAAGSSYSPFFVAQPEMRRLADEYDVVCSAVSRDGYFIEVRDRATSLSHAGYSVPIGARLKLRVPLAGVYLAPLPDDQVDDWIRGAEPPPTPEQARDQHLNVEFVRKHGFNALLTRAEIVRQSEYEAFGDNSMSFPVAPILELADAAAHPVTSILAPVIGQGGQVEFALGLMGFNRTMDSTEIGAIGANLREACNRIASYIAGRER